jgi:hypothetical protein
MVHTPRLTVIEGRARSPIGAALELAALGAGLTLVVTLLAGVPSWFHDLGRVQGLFLVAFAFYTIALLRLPRYVAIPHAGLAVFAVALATRLALLPVPPSLSGDLDRYVWEGKVVAHGGDPYRQPPLDPRLVALRDRAIYPGVNHKELATIYPPLAIAGFALVAALSPTILAFKLWITLHDLALVLLLLAWARREHGSAVPALAYAWNPLVLVEYAGGGHHDPTALVWMAAALVLAPRRPTASALALAAGALVKLAPLAALPFLWRRWPWRARLAALAVLGAGFALYGSETRGASSGLRAYWGAWRNNELAFHYLERWTGSFAGARAVALLVVGLAAAYALWRRWGAAAATRLTLRAGLLAGPVLHPWYLGWELAFQPVALSAPWLLLSATAILNYGVFATPLAGRDFHLPLAWRWLELGLPLALAAALAVRGRRGGRRGRGPEASPHVP